MKKKINKSKRLLLSILPAVSIGILIYILTKFNNEIKFKHPLWWLFYFVLFGLLISMLYYSKIKKTPLIIIFVSLYLVFIFFSVYSSYLWLINQQAFHSNEFPDKILAIGFAGLGFIINMILLVIIHIISWRTLKK